MAVRYPYIWKIGENRSSFPSPGCSGSVGESFGDGIWSVVQLQYDLFDPLGNFRVHASSVMEGTVYCSGGNTCKLGNFFICCGRR